MSGDLRGLVLLGHGARDAAWAAPFEAVCARVQARSPGALCRLAFLELMPPDLEQAAGELAQAGCARVDIVPVFLGMGGHVRRDVPARIEALRARHAAIDWRLHPALGESPGVIAALAEAALAAAGFSPTDPEARR